MSDMLVAPIQWSFFAVVVGVVVFFLLREFWTWYFKQSEQVALLKEISRSLQLLEERGRPLPSGVVPPAGSAYEAHERPRAPVPTA